MEPNTYKLRTLLLGYVVIPVWLIIGVSGAYSLYKLKAQVETRMQEDIELIARAIRVPLSHALERDRAGGVQQALNSAFEIDRVYGMYVYDKNGRRVAGSGPLSGPIPLEHAAQLASEGSQRGEFARAGNETVFSYFVPLTDTGGRINGLLQVTRRGADFSDYVTRMRNLALVALTSIAALLIIVVLVGHYGAVGKYLRRIERGMVQIGSGNTGHRVPVEGPSEFRVLSAGINDMLNRIAKSRVEIDKSQSRELELRARLQQGEKLAAIGQLAAGIAHELGTPLSTLDGKAQQLLRYHREDHRLHRALEQIRAETARMEQIIRQLLDFGRNNPLNISSMDCATIIRSAMERIEQEFNLRDIEVVVQPPPDSVTIRVDKVRMEQAITNLLRNAVQACRRQVRVSWSETPNHFAIVVEDDGAGIKEARKHRLFDPFYTTKPAGEGTGLGLSVAHAAVADHGGFIEAGYSNGLRGASFRIILEKEWDAR